MVGEEDRDVRLSLNADILVPFLYLINLRERKEYFQLKAHKIITIFQSVDLVQGCRHRRRTREQITKFKIYSFISVYVRLLFLLN